jgi:fumarate hydratase subunit alpha
MRTIDVGILTQLISDMVQQSGVHLPPDVYHALQKAQESETSPIAKGILASLVKNADIAHSEGIPICQDCGMAFVFLEIGQDVHFINGDLETAINAGVAKGYKEAYLRKSVVAEPYSIGSIPGTIRLPSLSPDCSGRNRQNKACDQRIRR